MKKARNEITTEYYTLIKSLPCLSQEEIDALYHEEEIFEQDVYERILALESKLEEYKDKLDLEPLDQSIEQLKKEVQNIEQLKKEIDYLKYIMDSNSLYCKTIRGKNPSFRKYPSLELRNKIVEGNLYIAIYWASIYYHKSENRIPFDDLYSLACEALMSAAHYYIPNDKAKFKTYARKCIENKLKKEVYHQKKMKKRPYKIKEFFKRERTKIDFLYMFLKNQCDLKKTWKIKGYKTFYNWDSKYKSLIIHRMASEIKDYNHNLGLAQEQSYFLPKIYHKSYEEVLEIFYKLIKQSKISVLVTDEEIRDIDDIINYLYITNDKPLLRAKMILDTYAYKLNLIEKYIESHNELLEEQKDVDDIEILKRINQHIKEQNKEIKRRKKEGFYRYPPSYREPVSFYEGYYDLYNVDILFDREEDEDKQILDSFGYIDIDELVSNWQEYIEEIKNNISKKYFVCFENIEIDENPIKLIVECIPYKTKKEIPEETILEHFNTVDDYNEIDFIAYTANYNYDELDIFEGTEVLKMLENLLENFKSEKDIIKYFVKIRSQKVNEYINEKNKPILEQNKVITQERKIYFEGSKQKKYLNERNIQQINDNLAMLYTDDAELLDFLLSKEKQGRVARLNVEEEAMQSMFLDDYYEALETLSPLEQQIMKLYYNEDGTNTITLKEIAKQLGINVSKVKNEKTKALKKLQTNPKMLSYYNERN